MTGPIQQPTGQQSCLRVLALPALRRCVSKSSACHRFPCIHTQCKRSAKIPMRRYFAQKPMKSHALRQPGLFESSSETLNVTKHRRRDFVTTKLRRLPRRFGIARNLTIRGAKRKTEGRTNQMDSRDIHHISIGRRNCRMTLVCAVLCFCHGCAFRERASKR